MANELFLATKQTKWEMRNAFANKMSTIKKLSKAQISTIIQSEGFFGVRQFRQKALTDLITRLARDNLPGLVSKSASNLINKLEIK